MKCPSCGKAISGKLNPGSYKCGGCGAGLQVNPSGLLAMTQFVLGDSSQGYSVGQVWNEGGDIHLGWESAVWNEGVQWRTDGPFPTHYEAVEYALGRAYGAYGRSWVRKHARQFEKATGYDYLSLPVPTVSRLLTLEERAVRNRLVAASATGDS